MALAALAVLVVLALTAAVLTLRRRPVLEAGAMLEGNAAWRPSLPGQNPVPDLDVQAFAERDLERYLADKKPAASAEFAKLWAEWQRSQGVLNELGGKRLDLRSKGEEGSDADVEMKKQMLVEHDRSIEADNAFLDWEAHVFDDLPPDLPRTTARGDGTGHFSIAIPSSGRVAIIASGSAFNSTGSPHKRTWAVWVVAGSPPLRLDSNNTVGFQSAFFTGR